LIFCQSLHQAALQPLPSTSFPIYCLLY
jgi:hypothetical protein